MSLFSTAAGRGILVLLTSLCARCAARRRRVCASRRRSSRRDSGGDVALDVTRPLVRVSRALHLTTPRHELQVAIGRANEDRIDARVHLTLPPPAGPLPPPRRDTDQPAAGRGPRRSRSSPPRTRCVSGSPATRSRRCPATRSSGSAAPIDVVGVESRLSTGLARPDLYNWYTRFNQLIAGVKPQVAVLSFGADDAHDYLAGVPGGKSVGGFGTPALDRGVPPARRRRHPRAERRRHQDGLARPADPGRPRLQAQLPDRERDPRRPSPRTMRAARSTSTRGTCSTAPTASTRRTCACTGS